MVTFVAFQSLDMRTFFSESDAFPELSYTPTATTLTIVKEFSTFILRGTGLTYDIDGAFTGGTVQSMEESRNGSAYWQLSGADYLATTLESFYDVNDVWDNIAANNYFFAGDDLITGSVGNDWLDGYGGNDSISGGAGEDTLVGGAGNDTFSGDSGADTVSYADDPGPVTVVMPTGPDGDAAWGTAQDGFGGTDRFYIGTADILLGSAFGDSLTGSPVYTANWGEVFGRDDIQGGAGDDTIYGLGGDDYLLAGDDGNDSIEGGDGADELEGGAGNDTLIGGASGTSGNLGDDFDVLTGGTGDDVLDGTGGSTVVLYVEASTAVDIDLAAPTVADGDGGTDTLIEIEGVAGSAFDDTLTGTDDDNFFAGFGGNDSITGGGGFDIVFYDDDSLVTTAVNVNLTTTLATGNGNDTLLGIEGVVGSVQNDTITGDGNDNLLAGSDGNDSIRGEAGNDTLVGGAGNDTMWGGDGDDSLVGGDGFDVAVFANATANLLVDLGAGTATGEGNDTLDSIEGVVGGSGNDTLLGTNANEFFRGSLGDDSISGGGGVDTAAWDLNGGAAVLADLVAGTATGQGSDVFSGIENLRGGAGNDTLVGDGVSNDLQGRDGNDSISGGDGNDTLLGENGNDTLLGGAGEDFLTGGAGDDLIDGGATFPAAPGFTYYDIADFSAATAALTINLGGGNGTASGQGTDTLLGIESARGGSGNDTITGDALDNVLRGNGGDDSITGGDGFDVLDYGNAGGSVTVHLGDGIASGAAGNDVFSGMEMVVGGASADTLTGSAGDDVLRGGLGNDVLDGGDGIDRADYRLAGGGVTVNLGAGQSSGADGNDLLSNIENARGSQFYNDLLIGNGGANLLEGRGGADTLIGGGGDDTLDGGTITDLINLNDLNQVDYSSSTSGIVLNLQTNLVQDGFGGTDTLIEINWVVGSAQNDVLTGSTRLIFEQFTGGAGNDTIDGGVMTETLHQTNGNRVAFGSINTSVTVDLGATATYGTATGVGIGTDRLVNIHQVVGTSAGDFLYGSNSTVYVEQFRAGAGNDLIDGRGGLDVARYDVFGAGPVVANLALGTASDGFGGTDTLRNVEGLRGGAGNDSLTGGAVASNALEFFMGMAGNDTINGGSGYDRAEYQSSGVAVSVTLGGTLAGAANDGFGGIDTLLNIEGVRGSTFNDTLTGSAIATLETFEGREGNDTINGVSGLDRVIYEVSFAAVTVNLTTGTAADGYGGTDTLSNIDDVIGSRNFNDSITGNTGANRLEGLGGNDALLGGAGNDTLDGGLGNDTLTGGDGNDTYVVNATTDVVSELGAVSSTIDTVQSAANWSLNKAGNLLVEKLTLTGTALTGIGNALNNTIIGTAGNNLLDGGLGNDTLTGGNGNDTYVVNSLLDVVSELGTVSSTIDTVQSAANWSLNKVGNLLVEKLTLTGTALTGTGNALNNTILGTAGNNVLDGGLGNDTLTGGNGNDTYVVNSLLDVVSELGTVSSTIDTVQSAANWSLNKAGNLLVERLTLTGTALSGTGNGLANLITGNASNNILDGGLGNDTLSGSSGNDVLVGGAGNDSLSGGVGADIFRFNTALAANVDRMADFRSVDDTIQLDNAIFTAVGANGALNAAAYRAGAAAGDASDRIIYNAATGQIFYDANGNGVGGQILFATVAAGTAITVADFFIV